MVKEREPILFVCIENSSRSQMAEGFAKRLGLLAVSAGTIPAARVNPLVVRAMKEKGVDISENSPKELTPGMVEEAGLVVLTDASLRQGLETGLLRKERKKVQKKLVEWNLPDPQGQTIETIRVIRDDIERMVSGLVST